MLQKAVLFLLETKQWRKARRLLDHPYWVAPRQSATADSNGAMREGWGHLVWGEAVSGIALAFRRLGDERAAYMLQVFRL